MKNLHESIYEEGYIDKDQFQRLDSIESGKVISLYYELRLLLYLGILLFTGGVGYIVYQNMSDIGHILMMSLLFILIGTGFYFINKKAKPYSNTEISVDAIYFDYGIVLLTLLIISLFTYIQVYFDLVELLLRWTSLLSGILFIWMAYYYDNKMVLAMAITAFAATLGLSVSPVNWAQGDFVKGMDLYVMSLIYGGTLIGVAHFLEAKKIKQHFSFTYQNFGLLLMYFGALAIMVDNYQFGVWMALILIPVVSIVAAFCWKKKYFLFFLYSSLCGYIALTFLMLQAEVSWEAMLFYFPITCIGGVILLIKNRKHFSDDQYTSGI